MSFREQFPLIQSYSTGFDRYHTLKRLNCLYNKAVLLAETENEDNEIEAVVLCEQILKERKSHMEAYALLQYLCS